MDINYSLFEVMFLSFLSRVWFFIHFGTILFRIWHFIVVCFSGLNKGFRYVRTLSWFWFSTSKKSPAARSLAASSSAFVGRVVEAMMVLFI